MANDVQTSPEQASVTGLVTGIVNDAQELFKQQVALLKHEVREDLRKTRDAALALAAGAVVTGLGVLFLCCTVALFLAWAIPGLAEWGAFLIVGAVLAVVGLGLLYAGKKKFDSFNPLPEETAEALKENVQWILKPK
jgi:uncharacterized membrane protein YqjE